MNSKLKICENCYALLFDIKGQKVEVRGRESGVRQQITDTGNQIARIVHPFNPFDSPAPSIE